MKIFQLRPTLDRRARISAEQTRSSILLNPSRKPKQSYALSAKKIKLQQLGESPKRINLFSEMSISRASPDSPSPSPQPPPISESGNSWIDKIPVVVIGTVNAAASYWGAVILRAGVEKVFPALAKITIFSHLFNPQVSTGINKKVLLERFINTMVLNYRTIFPVFAAASLLNVLPHSGQRKAVMRILTSVAHRTGINKLWNAAPGRKIMAAGKALSRVLRQVHQQLSHHFPAPMGYLNAFVSHGVIGVIQHLNTRNAPERAWLVRSKQWMRSKPLTRGLRKVIGLFTGVTIGIHRKIIKKRISQEQLELTMERHIQRAATITTVGARIMHGPDQFIDFIGRVTPSDNARFVGLAVDIGAGTAAAFLEALVFGAPFNGSTFYQALIINILTSYANVGINQHPTFSKNQIWGWRTYLGILKGSVFRGICATPSVSAGFSYGAQALFGLWAVGKANRITGGATASSRLITKTEHEVALREQLSNQGII